MTDQPEPKFYAVVAFGSRHAAAKSVPPSSWEIYPVGRETAARLYFKAAKPEKRYWGNDPYRDKDRELTRFATHEEAVAFIEDARQAMSEPLDAVERAREAYREAEAQLIKARAGAIEAVKAFWNAHDGERGQ